MRKIKLRRKILILTLSISVTAFLILQGDAAEEIENLARGGDFENDADLGQWSFWRDGGAATFTIDEKNAAIGKASAFMDITKASPPEPWAPGLTQLPFNIKKGKTYTFSAFLKAEKNRELVLEVRFHGNGQTPQFLNKRVTVGTEWEEQWGTFTAQESSSPVGILFVNTGSKVSYWIDGVRFYEGEYVPTKPGEKAVTSIDKLAATWAIIKN